MRRALVVFLGVLCGCRAILGIEDPPAEGAGGGASTTTSLAGFTTSGSPVSGSTASGDGGAASMSADASSSTSSANDGGGGSMIEASAQSATGPGGGGGGGGGGGAGPPTPLVFDLDAAGVRLALDEENDMVFVVDGAGHFWALSDDFTDVTRCTEPDIQIDAADGGSFAAFDRGIAYVPDGEKTWFIYVDEGWDVRDDRDCKGIYSSAVAFSSVATRDGRFYGMEYETATLYEFPYGIFDVTGPVSPPDETYILGERLVFGDELAFATVHVSTNILVLGYDPAGQVLLTGLQVPDTQSLEALAATRSDIVYAWKRVNGANRIVSVVDQLVTTVPVYTGTPTLAADEAYIYVPTESGLVLCPQFEDCRILRGNDQRVADVKVTQSYVFILQGNQLLRYDWLESSVYDTLDAYP
jgi:hypothetical protein